MGRKSKPSRVSSALDSPLPGVWGWLWAVGESLSSSWRMGTGGGQGACGWGLGRKGRRQRFWRGGATRTTPSWK